MVVRSFIHVVGLCALAAILLLSTASTNISAADDRRVALVIGNGAYDHLNKLANPPRDATLMADKLRSVGFEVDLAINDDQWSLKQRVRSFARRARGASAALFYYAGHGIQAEGSNFLLPVDAKLRQVADLHTQSLPMSSVSDALDFADAKISLIILDACRNNPLTRSLVLSNGTRSVKLTRGLASMRRASGRLVAYATAPGQVAYEGSNSKNSPFTQAVADWIEEPGLEIEHMFFRVREQVIEATKGKQVPWIEHAILGDFYFQPISPDVAPTLATLSPEPSAALNENREHEQPSPPSYSQPNDPIETAWSKAAALGTRDAYLKFLEQYPDSAFAGEAVSMLLQLASSATPATPAPEPAALSSPAVSPSEVTDDHERERPSAPSYTQANDPIEIAWSKATALGTRDAYLKFLEQYPNSAFAGEAVSMLLQFASPVPSPKASAGPSALQ